MYPTHVRVCACTHTPRVPTTRDTAVFAVLHCIIVCVSLSLLVCRSLSHYGNECANCGSARLKLFFFFVYRYLYY